jgi:IS5 family transposase
VLAGAGRHTGTWRKTPVAAAARWTDGRPAGRATPQVKKVRRRIEEIFGWIKTVGGLRRTRYRGLERVGFAGYLVAAAYNLVRLARLAVVASA